MLVETEWLEVMLIWLFASIKRRWKCDFSVFDRKYPFWSNLVQKIKIVSLKWNLEPEPIRTWMLIFSFLTLNTLLGKFDLKYENCQTKLTSGTKTNLNMQNSVVVFSFFIFERNNPFWSNKVQKIKIVRLNWNLVRRLIWICWIQWWCSVFLF